MFADANGDRFEVVVQPVWEEVQIIDEDGRPVIELTRTDASELVNHLTEAMRRIDELEAGE